MKYYIDTEFIEDGKTIDLISIGIAADDGRTLYLQNIDCNFSKANDWVWRNVFPRLIHFNMSGKRSCLGEHNPNSMANGRLNHCGNSICPWRSCFEIRDKILQFCDPEKYDKPEFWGYYADYDWVAFCQLFGTMIQLPNRFPMYCRDIKQLCDDLGNAELQPQVVSTEHHALSDALWTKKAHEFLLSLKKP